MKQKIVIRKKSDSESGQTVDQENKSVQNKSKTEPTEKSKPLKEHSESNESAPEKTGNPKSKAKKFSLWLYIGIGVLIGAGIMILLGTLFPNEPDSDISAQSEQFLEGDALGSDEDVVDFSRNILSTSSTLSRLLIDEGVAQADAKNLDRKAIANGINNLQAGTKYTVYFDDSKVPIKVMLETKQDPYNKYAVDLEGFSIEKLKKESEIVTKSMAAIVESNLGITFINNNLDLKLITKVEDIFAWSIDLFRLADGDRFKILYEEEYLDGKPYQVLEIKAAYFNHKGEEFYAFRYNQNNQFEYYNESGQSMKKSFLKTPIKYGGVITSGFGLRNHPVQNYSKMHYGTDFAAPEGTPIQSVADGVILKAEFNNSNGFFVKVKHDDIYDTQYLHMTRYAEGMRPGVRVRQGDIIGFVGSTGLSTGPHVCYRFWKNNEQVDPKKERVGISNQIDPKLFSNYMKDVEPIQDKLSKIEYF